MKTYSFGAKVRVSAIFADSAGTSVDPTTIKFAYLAAAIGAATTLTYPADPALVKDSVGHYHVDIDSNESPGHFDWRFFSTGTNQAAQTGEFYISPNPTVIFIPPASAALLTLPLTVPNGGTGSTSFTTNGVLYGQGTSAVVSTAQGGANTVLSANAGAPSFSSTPTLTGLTLTSALSVANGGTGDTTLTTNGVLYGNATNAINVTAQGVTNSVLTASAGAPVFSATPTLTGLSLTSALSVANGGTGDVTLTTNGVLFGNATNAIQITAQGPANSVLIANAGSPSFSAIPIVTSLGATSAIAAGTATTNGALNVVGTSNFAGILQPEADNTRDFGTSSLRWKTGYFGTNLAIGAGGTGYAVDVVKSSTSGTGSIYPGIRVFNSSTATNSIANVELDGNNGSVVSQFIVDGLNGFGYLPTAGSVIGTTSGNPFGVLTNNIVRLAITSGGSVGIGNTAPTTSTAFEVNSTTGALLIPRMTSTQRDALTAIDGMIIYNTTTAKFQGREAGAWNNFSVL